MHPRWLVAASSGLLMSSGCARQQASETAASRGAESVLPLVRVRLYASGVGYFERKGAVAAEESALPVPAAHLDDALKTLVVFDAGRDLGSVSFPSRLSPAVARARAGLPADQEAPLSYDRLLGALRGEKVELSLSLRAKPIRGRVIDVVAVGPDHPSYDHGPPHRTVSKDAEPQEEKERLQVLLLSERGEILRLDASGLLAVRALDDIVARRLHAALSARLATRSGQHQRLELKGAGGSATEVTLAYLAEAPTWRPSYRLLFDGGSGAPTKNQTARLQAWALVHNDTEERWRGVRLELVDGRPNSFLFPITAPRYERRELVTPEEELSSVPQLSTTTPDALWGDFSDYAGEQVARVGSEGISGVGAGGGFGHGTGALGGSHRTRAPKLGLGTRHEGSDLIWVGDLALQAGLAPRVEHTTSVHRVESRVSLEPQHSAMVPFLDQQVRAAPLLWFNGFSAHAERAIGLSNTTQATLPAGPLAVYGHGGFLGEAMLASLKPGERQFAQISDEPDAALHAGATRQDSVKKHVDFGGGRLRTHSVQTSKTRLVFDNQSGRARQAYVALPVVLNATVSGSEAVDFENSSGRAFAVFRLPAGVGQERLLVTTEGISHGIPTADLTRNQLEELGATDSLPQAERDVLRRAMPLLGEWQASRQRDEALGVEVGALEADLGRLKQHLGTLGKSEAESAHAQLMQRILEREERLSELHARQRALQQELKDRQQAFENVLAELERFREQILEERRRSERAHTARR